MFRKYVKIGALIEESTHTSAVEEPHEIYRIAEEIENLAHEIADEIRDASIELPIDDEEDPNT